MGRRLQLGWMDGRLRRRPLGHTVASNRQADIKAVVRHVGERIEPQSAPHGAPSHSAVRPLARRRGRGTARRLCGAGQQGAHVGALLLKRRAQNRRRASAPRWRAAQTEPVRRRSTTSTVGPRPRWWPRVRRAPRALGELERARGEGPAMGWCRWSWRPRARRSQSPRASPRTRAKGVGDTEDGVGERHLGRRAARARWCRGPAWYHGERLEAREGRSDSGAVGGHTSPRGSAAAASSGCPFSSPRDQQGGVELEEVVGCHQPGEHGGGARAEAPESGMSERMRKVKPIGGSGVARTPGRRGSRDRARRRDRSRRRSAPASSPRARGQGERGGEAVETGAEVGRGGGHANVGACGSTRGRSLLERRPNARGYGRAGSCRRGGRMAVSGSLRPWPVSTQATRSAPSVPYLSRPATDAAEAGSQKTPSREARRR